MNPENLVPNNEKGSENNVSAEAVLASMDEARAFFNTVKQRLLDVNNWHGLAGKGTARFQVVDSEGNSANRPVETGDYLKIDIPGPGGASGEGFDWVKVENIVTNEDLGEESILVTVRPTTNPFTTDNNVAHFFTGDATSNFLVVRKSTTVEARVHGRNEVPNVQETDSLVDKARNAIIGGGAAAGISKLQWKALVEGLVRK